MARFYHAEPPDEKMEASFSHGEATFFHGEAPHKYIFMHFWVRAKSGLDSKGLSVVQVVQAPVNHTRV